jgi:hypothetical protein
MEIFAKNATEIEDDVKVPTTGYSRYKDTSSRFSDGFLYNYYLNSALINGFLHKTSTKLENILHFNAKNIPELNINRPSRYNTAEEIANVNYTDKENYIKKESLKDFLTARVNNKLLKTDEVSDFYSPDRTNNYLPKSEAIKSKELFFGTNLPPKQVVPVAEYDKVPAFTDNSLIIEPNLDVYPLLKSDNLLKNVYVLFKIPKKDPLYIYKIRKVRGKSNLVNPNNPNYDLSSTPCVVFQEDMLFQGKTISHETVFIVENTATIIVKGNQLLSMQGVNNFQKISQNEVIKAIDNATKY